MPSTPTARAAAQALVTAFGARPGGGRFSGISRAAVASALTQRIATPGAISQSVLSLCGPAALLFTTARDDPTRYAQFIIDLYEKGQAKLGNLDIAPGADARTYAPPPSVNAADWIGLASIRDSANWFFDYQSAKNQFAGITMPNELVQWFKEAGYTEVINETNTFFNKNRLNALKASHLFNLGYKVSLFISAKMLRATEQTDNSSTPDHWVVLTSGILLVPSVRLTVYTWGRPRYRIPQGSALTESDFLDNYYGFVACRR